MAANVERGEVAITIGGQERTLAPSWQALVSIEGEIGQGIAVTFSRITAGDFRFTDALAVIGAGRAAAGEKVNRDQVATEILKAGYLGFREQVQTFLVNAIFGGKDPAKEGEAKAEGTGGTLSADT